LINQKDDTCNCITIGQKKRRQIFCILHDNETKENIIEKYEEIHINNQNEKIL